MTLKSMPPLPPLRPLEAHKQLILPAVLIYCASLAGLISLFLVGPWFGGPAMLAVNGIAWLIPAKRRSVWGSHIFHQRQSSLLLAGMIAFWLVYATLDMHGMLWPKPGAGDLKSHLFEDLVRIWLMWACIVWLALRFLKGLGFAAIGKAGLRDLR